MPHQFEECMISCQDPRLNKIHFELINKRGMLEQTDTIFWGNPILDLIEPKSPKIKEFVLSKIDIAITAHKIKTVRLYNHFDCGYYQLRGFKFTSKEEEQERLISDLKKAAQIIQDKFSGAKFNIFLYLLDQDDEGWQEEEIG